MRVDKTWGFEEILYNGEYCCKRLVYTKPIASSLHFHRLKHETFVVGSGIYHLEIYEESQFRELRQGDFVVIPPKTRHRLHCIEPGFLVEASTHDDPEDCVRVIPSES